ncbi:MAG TPA: hypothetical protein VLM11_08140 [Streptosporangiaceae bacterium]|nr:hypothetical protein [Streptosporangiaceae bacterium]
MSSSDGRWTELSSHNERIVQAGYGSTDDVLTAAPTEWAELASQSERLVGAGDPLFQLASSCRGETGMRLVASAA